jgi:hypothetical protein
VSPTSLLVARNETSGCRHVDGLGDGSGEADDVVVERFFSSRGGRRGRAIGKPLSQPDLIFLKSCGTTPSYERFTGKEFDLQPNLEFVFVGQMARICGWEATAIMQP